MQKGGQDMALATAWRKLRWSVEHRGVRATLRVSGAALGRGLLRRRRAPVAAHPWDAKNGVETSGLLGGGSLAIGHRNDTYIVGYAGVPPSRFTAVLERWKSTLSGAAVEDFSFLDLGCGKGRALLLASEWGFREVVGVELNPELAATAEKNGRVWKDAGRARCPIRVLRADATEFAWPAGPLLIFIYNSFAAPVTRGVLHRLALHAAAGEHRLHVIYQNEGDDVPLRTDPRLQLLWSDIVPMSEGDAAVDPAASVEDRTSVYCWKT